VADHGNRRANSASKPARVHHYRKRLERVLDPRLRARAIVYCRAADHCRQTIASTARNNRTEITRTGNSAVRDRHAHAFEFRGSGWKIGNVVCLSRCHVVLENLASAPLE
jgi:hypothetical protein